MIDTSNWEEFRVGELFSCETTLGISSKKDLEDGDINYITRRAADNGFSGTCGNEDHRNKGDCITIGAEGFIAFWQNDDFVAGNKVYALRHPAMNEINGLFICSALNALSDRYSFADARVLDKIKTEVIKLPATSDGQPDWAYMESYMKSVMEESKASIKNLRSANDYRHKIDISNWEEFRIGDLFRIEPAKGKNQQQLDDGDDVPYIAASKENNGFNRMVSVKGHEDWVSKGNCLQFIHIGDAAAGHVNYIPDDFIGMSGKSSCAYNDNINEYTGLFLAGIITHINEGKYSFKDSWTGAKVQNTIIKLPATPDGSPDWAYMERYMRDIMAEAEQNVLALNM